jgi:sugar phosphate isomerase/epimerase
MPIGDPPPRTVLSQGSFLHLETGEFMDTSAAAGFDAVTVWRHAPGYRSAAGASAAARAAGIAVSAVCRGGQLTPEGHDESLRALEDAAALGSRNLVVVAQPYAPAAPVDAMTQFARALEKLLPEAERAGITLVLEPFHPMFASSRSCLVTLAQANDIAETLDSPFLGIALDSYHLWWDPDLPTGIRRAGRRIAAVQLADWTPLAGDVLRARGVPGEGVIPFPSFLRQARQAGYQGPVEIEVLSDRFCAQPALEAARTLRTALGAVVEAEERSHS